MADVQWIRITTDMFDNRKIKHLRKLPEGNNIVLIWVMLLTMAGRCNAGGMIFLTENIPYTTKMLADELGFEENTIRLALQVFEELHMVTTDQEYLCVPGWEEYQNVEGLDRIREQTRVRVANHRERKRLSACNVTGNVTVTPCNATEEDKEVEVDIEDISSSLRSEDMGGSAPSEPKAPERGKRTAVKFVPPTLEEVEAYAASRQSTVDPRRFFEYFNTPDAQGRSWRDSKGNPVKNWKQKFLTWEGRDGGKGKPAPAASRTDKPRKSWTELAAEMDAEEGRTT
jgi:predicted phage replisome organizer